MQAWHFPDTNNPVSIVFILIWLTTVQLVHGQEGTVQSNPCEALNSDGIVVYKACGSQPALLFGGSTASPQIDVAPQDFTCGLNGPSPFCTLVS